MSIELIASHFVRPDPLDETLKTYVPVTFYSRIPYLPHHPFLAWSPRRNCMCDTIRHNPFWGHIANIIEEALEEGRSFAQEGSKRKHKGNISLFPLTAPLDFVAINFLRRLPQTPLGTQHLALISDQFSKLNCTISARKTTSTHLAIIFFDNLTLLIPFQAMY